MWFYDVKVSNLQNIVQSHLDWNLYNVYFTCYATAIDNGADPIFQTRNLQAMNSFFLARHLFHLVG